MLVCCLYYLEENGEIFSVSDKRKKKDGAASTAILDPLFRSKVVTISGWNLK